MLRLFPLATLVLSVRAYSVLVGRTGTRAQASVVPAACSMCAARSRSADFLEEAKNEEEQAYETAMAAAAELARSPEVIAAQRTAGEAAAAAIRAAIDAGDESHPAAAMLAKKGKAPATGKLRKALKKPKGSLSVIGEGVPLEGLASMGGFDLTRPEYLSKEFRDGGATAVCVTVGDDAISEDAVAETLAEQSTAKGEFPGPVPVIVRAPFVDEVQLAAAAADGAMGVVLPFSLNGAEQTGMLMEAATQLGLESVVRVCSAEELSAAAELKPTMIAIGDCTLLQADELLAAVPADMLAIADIPTPDVRGAWKVRDLGFAGLISGKSMMDVCVRDRVPPSAITKAILSKGSVKYGLGMQKGRLEGSKETLGSISM